MDLAGENPIIRKVQDTVVDEPRRSVDRPLISVSVARILIRIPPLPASCRSNLILRPHLGVLYHDRPPVELRLQHERKLPGRTPHNIPTLLAKLLEDVRFLERPMQIGEDLGHVLEGHVRGTK